MSKTEENLKAAFAGESQARNKYTYFAKAAKKEGYHYNDDERLGPDDAEEPVPLEISTLNCVKGIPLASLPR